MRGAGGLGACGLLLWPSTVLAGIALLITLWTAAGTALLIDGETGAAACATLAVVAAVVTGASYAC